MFRGCFVYVVVVLTNSSNASFKILNSTQLFINTMIWCKARNWVRLSVHLFSHIRIEFFFTRLELSKMFICESKWFWWVYWLKIMKRLRPSLQQNWSGLEKIRHFHFRIADAIFLYKSCKMNLFPMTNLPSILWYRLSFQKISNCLRSFWSSNCWILKNHEAQKFSCARVDILAITCSLKGRRTVLVRARLLGQRFVSVIYLFVCGLSKYQLSLLIDMLLWSRK